MTRFSNFRYLVRMGLHSASLIDSSLLLHAFQPRLVLLSTLCGTGIDSRSESAGYSFAQGGTSEGLSVLPKWTLQLLDFSPFGPHYPYDCMSRPKLCVFLRSVTLASSMCFVRVVLSGLRASFHLQDMESAVICSALLLFFPIHIVRPNPQRGR